MSSGKPFSSVSAAVQQSLQHLSPGTLCKSIATGGLILFLLYTVLFNPPYCSQSMDRFALFKLKWPLSPDNATSSATVTTTDPTGISHIVFGVVSSVNTWERRKSYVESWWRPNVTRGYIFLDRDPSQRFHPWPSSSPPFRVNEPIKSRRNSKYVSQIRIVRTIMETFMQGDNYVRWYVMADDDTILFVDNLVEVLAKYNHTEYFYIGMNSECVGSNVNFAFEMAFGGAGYALSYPLAEALSTKLDGCIQRYPNVFSSDFILQTCLADFGVPLTHHGGFHQIDLHGDISGLLSAHPQSPVLSLHHIDFVDPIFPSMNRSASVNHLMEAAKVDHSRLLEQTICYQRKNNWSFSTSWGYSTHMYENIHPRSFLLRPIETFKPWLGIFKPPLYMFNTRSLTNDPCEAPHEFFMESVEKTRGDQVVTTFIRKSPRNLPPCSSSGNHSANHISKIQVFSSATTLKKAGQIECCDVEETADMNITRIKLRACMKDEIIA
ncbi:hypothetical protein DKX38_024749 [Salix brachista]|uniref:Uncharacterized protein n=1 Tax=Salix brachista TaxID=2182728 RepID=A0A5N5JSJ0_9ROSI|nr:hypothetical protein DKX38_024749 [Salix brachista]